MKIFDLIRVIFGSCHVVTLYPFAVDVCVMWRSLSQLKRWYSAKETYDFTEHTIPRLKWCLSHIAMSLSIPLPSMFESCHVYRSLSTQRALLYMYTYIQYIYPHTHTHTHPHTYTCKSLNHRAFFWFKERGLSCNVLLLRRCRIFVAETRIQPTKLFYGGKGWNL